MVIKNFKNRGTYDVAFSKRSKVSLKVLPVELHRRARYLLAVLDAANSLDDLKELPGCKLKQLRGKRRGQYSIRINDQYRLVFEWDGKNADLVEILDYH